MVSGRWLIVVGVWLVVRVAIQLAGNATGISPQSLLFLALPLPLVRLTKAIDAIMNTRKASLD